MIRLSVIVALPLALFGGLSASATVPHKNLPALDALLVPRQTYRIETQAKSGAQKPNVSEQTIRNRVVAVTPRVLVVGLPASGAVAAFDRSTGRELWRRQQAVGSDTNGSALITPSPNGGKPGGSDVFGTDQTSLVAQPNHASAAWYLIGTAARQDGSGIIVLMRRIPIQSGVSREPGPNAELRGVDAEGGTDQWRFGLAEPRLEDQPRPIGIYNDLITFLYPDQIVNATTGKSERGGKGGYADFLDAFTGHTILPSTMDGRDALKRAAKQHGSSFVLSFDSPNSLRLVRLDTGKAQPLTTPGYAGLVGVTAARGIILVNMDNDAAGASVWPHYVYAVDNTGRTAWQFPLRHLLPGVDFDPATGRGFSEDKRPLGHDFEDVTGAQVVAAASIVFVTSVTPYQAQDSNLYGLRDADGRVLWRRSARGIRLLRAYKQGCFALLETGRLAYVDAQTGQRQSCGRLPACLDILPTDKDLFAINSDGTITAYDIARLLKPAAVSRSHAVTVRRKQQESARVEGVKVERAKGEA